MNNLDEEIRAIVTGTNNQENQDSTEPPQQDIQDVYVLIVREQEEGADTARVVDSSATVPTHPAPVTVQQDSFLSAYSFVCFSLLLVLATLTFQLYCLFNPPIAIITIIPKSQEVTLNGTLQLGRLLQPITISQSQTIATTGHGHQDARSATGYITFYNGQLTSVFVPAGTVLTGSDGAQIETTQDANIPASNLPQVGQTTVSAHAISPGSKGNIPAFDINQGCCATAIKAVNTTAFYGGQDERTFSTVTQHDIHSVSTVLKSSLSVSMQGALQGQRKPSEQLSLLPCHPTVTSDHLIGAEAIQVKVTVSLTCSGIAYNTQELQTHATQLLTTQAAKKLGTGYSLFGNIHMKVNQASVTSTAHQTVFLAFTASGAWLFGLSRTSQEHIKALLAGQSTEQAIHTLLHSPGIEQAAIRLSGFGNESRLPKNSHLMQIVVLAEPT